MARLTKRELIDLAVEAIAANGWTVTPLTAPGKHPARFIMERDGVEHTVRLYIWNLSHGGKTRSSEEFRIQVTGIDRFEPEPNGRTLLLGWGDDFGVFAGFDIQRRLSTFGASPSIQIKAATLQAAGETGAGTQDKGRGENAIGLRPDKLGRYVQHLAKVHAGNLEPLLAPETDKEADPLTSEISRLANDSVDFNLDASGGDDLREDIISAAHELLAALETDDPDAPPHIGHNQPPEEIDDHQELAPEIEEATSQILSELSSPQPDARRVGNAGAFLAWAGRLLQLAREEGARVLDKGKDLAREYAVKVLGRSVTAAVLFYKEEIIELLRKVASAILQWLQHISII